MADSQPPISKTSRNVMVNGKLVDLLAQPVHHGFSMYDAPALRLAASNAEAQLV